MMILRGGSMFALLAMLPSMALATGCGPGTLLNSSTGRCHVSADACGLGAAYDAALGLCVGQPLQLVGRERRTETGASNGIVAPRITTEQGAVVISGANVAVHTEACPDADLDVCAIDRSIAAVQTNLDQGLAQAATNATVLIAGLSQSSSEALQTSIGGLSTSVASAQTTAIGTAQATTMAEVASLLGRIEAAMNVTKCQMNPIDACGFMKACNGGLVTSHSSTCENCSAGHLSFHDYGTGADGDWRVTGMADRDGQNSQNIQGYGYGPNVRPADYLARYFGAHRINAPMRTDTTLHTVNSGADNHLSPGDEVVVFHQRSRGFHPGNIEDMFAAANSHYGHYEFHRISSVSSSPRRYHLVTPISRHFYNPSSAVGRNNQVVYMQKVPNFNNVELGIGANVYGGDARAEETVEFARTGMAFMRVKGTMMMNQGSFISMRGNGFGRGMRSDSGNCRPGWTGEGPTVTYRGNDNPFRSTYNTGPVVVLRGGGGHGGDLNRSWCPNRPASTGSGNTHAPMGGGGGSHLTRGAVGSNMPDNAGSHGYGDTRMRTFFLGSGGGGASSYRHSSGHGYGGYGGDGGGSIMLFANKLKMHPDSHLDVRGVDGANRYIHGGSGGGGAGGAVSVQCGSECEVTQANILATGGRPGAQFYAGARGGAGSKGRVRVSKAGEKRICINTAASEWSCSDFDNKTAYCNAM